MENLAAIFDSIDALVTSNPDVSKGVSAIWCETVLARARLRKRETAFSPAPDVAMNKKIVSAGSSLGIWRVVELAHVHDSL